MITNSARTMAQQSLYRTCTRLLSRDPHNIGVRAYTALQASTHGEPAEVLRIQELELPKQKAGEVVVDVLGVMMLLYSVAVGWTSCSASLNPEILPVQTGACQSCRYQPDSGSVPFETLTTHGGRE